MKRSKSLVCAILACLAAGLPGVLLAASPKAPLSQPTVSPALDASPVINTSRMVTYTYNPNRSFVIRALAKVNTVIEAPAGETLRGFYLSESSDWHFTVTGDHKRVLLKPNEGALYNTALMVTDKRAYQLTLVSVNPQDTWFQRVSWVIPGANTNANGTFWTAGTYHEPASGSHGAADPSVDINPADMYFKYKVEGKAAFAPTAVFDDGRSTWLRMNPKSQDLPAIFAITDGKLDVVNYTPKGDYIVVPRVASELVLQLNQAKVTIHRDCDPARCLK